MAESTPGAGSARLALKIFLVALVAAAVVAATWAFVHGSPTDEAERPQAASVSRAWAAFSAEQQDRYDRLSLAARLLAAENPVRQVLRAGAPQTQAAPRDGDDAQGGAVSGEALADLLAQRRDELGYDFAYVLDGDGAVVATTEGADGAGADLSGRGLVAQGLEEGSGRGAWTRRDGRLAHAALEWVAPDFELLGYVVVGLDLDDVLALQLQRTTGAGVAFLAPVAGSSPGEQAAGGRTVGASLDPGVAEDLAAELADGGIRAVDEPEESRRVALGGAGGEVFEALIGPLRDASGDALGAVVVAAPAETGDGAAALPWIAGALGAALIVAFLFAVILARSTLSPVGRLAGMVRTAPQEGFARRPEPGRAGHLAPIAAALRRLFRDLQEERTLSATAAATAAAEVGSPGEEESEPQIDKPTLVGIDLRRYARLDVEVGGVRETADRLRRDETRVRSLVATHGGRLAGGAGHRLLAAFEGDGAAWRGVTAGAAILAVLGEKDSAFDEGDPPAVAVATGRAAHGAGSAGRPFLVGPAVQLVESLLREASPGELLMARPVHRAVAGEVEQAGVAARETSGILSPQPLFALDREMAGKLTAAADTGSAAATPVPGEIIGGRFEILAEKGGSGAGTLFLARDREMDREVALKRIVTAGGVGAEAGGDANRSGLLAAVRRFSHPNVAEVRALREVSGGGPGGGEALTFGTEGEASGEDGGFASGSAVLLAREWVAGAPLVVGRDLPLAATLGLARQLAAALAAIHGAGLVHGRLKPENVILVPGVGARLTDLGVGILAGSSLSASAGERLRAPEQSLDRLGDARSDVYAFGALLARLASGRWWSGEGAVAADGPEEQGGAGLPEDLTALLRRCLAPTPDARPEDGGELAAALDRVTA